MASLSEDNYNPEDYLLDTLNNLDIGFVKVSNDGIILTHNLTFNKIFGYNPKKNLIGTKTLDYWLNSEERNKFREVLYKEGTIKKYMTLAKKVDGEKIFLDLNFKLNKNSNGDIISSEGTFVDVTERKRTEQELKESEEKYKTILDGIVNGVWVTDKDDIIYYTNKGMEKIAGIPSEQIVNAKILIDFPESTLKYFRPYYLKAKNTLKTVFYDAVPVETPANRQSFQSGWLIPIEKEGKYDGIICTVEDVTERKKALSKLKASEEKFSKLFNHANDAIFLLKRVEAKFPWHFVEVNNKACQMYGYTKEEFLKMGPQDIIASECLHEVPSILHEILNTGHGTFYLTHVNKNGLKIPVEISSDVFELRKEAVTLSIVRDITERKKNEEKLKESEERFRRIIETAPFGYYRVGKDGLWQYVNPVWEKMHDYSLQEIIGKSFEITQPENAKEQARIYVQRVLSGEAMTGEFGRTKKDGTVEYHTFNIQPIYQKGEIIAIEGFINDITVLKETEQRLIVSESNLRKLNNELEQIIEERTKELKESEKKLKIIFENANDAISIHDLRGNFYTVNKTYCERLGYTREELLKLTPRDISTLEYADLIPSRILEVKEKGFGFFEAAHKTKDGRVIPVEISSRSIQYDNKPSILSIIRDITERKKAEQKLKESEEKYKNLSNELEIILDLIPGLLFCKDRNDIVTRVNQNFAEFLRMKKKDIIGKTSFDLFPEEQARKFREDDLEVINSGIPKLNIEESVDTSSGKTWAITSKVPQFNGEGKIIGIIGLAIDITERREKEKEVFDLAQFPSEDPYPILRVSRNGVMYINNAGQKLLNVVDSDQIPEIFQESVKNTFESNQISESEVEFDNRVYSFTITPIEDADYVNIYGMDITERKHVEEKLREINKLKSEFLRRASHELKTPLISIKGFSDLILSLYGDQLDTPIISKVREINDGCERLQNIINNLLKSSKLESTDLKPKVKKEDLSFLIKFCVHELESLAERRNQSIKLDIHNELYANIEKEEIHDVLSNLLSNAIKYTPPMGKIEIKAELKEDYVVVSVKDNGIGFTEEQKTKIFQQFGKIERYGQGLDLGIDGTGLGLYISKKIVESHHGEIWMESEGRSKGSTFYFTLPTVK